jgi:hypothetical protein
MTESKAPPSTLDDVPDDQRFAAVVSVLARLTAGQDALTADVARRFMNALIGARPLPSALDLGPQDRHRFLVRQRDERLRAVWLESGQTAAAFAGLLSLQFRRGNARARQLLDIPELGKKPISDQKYIRGILLNR